MILETFKTLKELFKNSVETFKDRPAFSMLGGEVLTYSDFANNVKNLQETLSNAGLNKGDKVVLLSSSMPNWGISYFAITTAGLVVVPILTEFAEAEINSIIKHSDAKALIVSDKQFHKVSKEVIESLNIVIRAASLAPLHWHDKTPTDLTVDPEPTDLAAIIYTSGTTSKPKGVMHSHQSLCKQVSMLLEVQDVQPDDVMLSILPLAHTYEGSLGLILPVYQGASVVYLDRPPTASILVDALRKVRPTLMLTVPLIMEKMYRSQVQAKFTANKFLSTLYSWAPVRRKIHQMAGRKLMKVFGGRLRFFGIGGAKLDATVEQFLMEAKFPYAIGYGLTETAPLLAGTPPSRVRLQSTGPVMSEIQARLDNVNPISGEGELVVKTPSIMMGYYKNEEATKEAFTPDGWFRTKDVATFDKDGYLYIKGRLGNMILGPSGENIYPEDIETVLNGHKLVTESLVKEDHGKLIALVYFDKDELEKRYQSMKDEISYKMDIIKQEIKNYVNSKVNKFSRIAEVEQMPNEFEKTPSKKIKRFLYTKSNTPNKK